MNQPLGRYRTPIAISTALLLLVIATGIYRRTHSTSLAVERATPSAPTSDMAGMPGMNAGGDSSVQITPTEIAQFGITFGTVERRTLTNDVRAVGTVVMNETKIASVTPKISGYVEQLHVNVIGQQVRRGQPLAEVYSPDLLAAQEELLLAHQLDKSVGQSAVPGVPASSVNLVDAAKRPLRLLDISDEQIDEVLRTGQTRRTVTLYSPANGVVVEKRIVQGQAIQAGAELYTVVDLSDVWVDVQLRETDAGLVNVGAAATLDFVSYPGRSYHGRVAFIYPTLADSSRTIRARVAVANADGRLKPGMFATVRTVAPSRAAITVPRTAVVQTGQRNLVFIDMGGGKLMPHDVEIGRSAGDLVEVLSGLEVGQRVVTSAQFLIDSESNLGEVMRSMMGSGGRMQGPSGSGDMKGMNMPARPPR